MKVVLLLLAAIGRSVAETHKSNVEEDTFVSHFDAPQVWSHQNLIRTIDLTGSYVKESITAILENVAETPQDTYYFPVKASLAAKMSFVTASEKPNKEKLYNVELVKQESFSDLEYYKIVLASAVKPQSTARISIFMVYVDELLAVPKAIEQGTKQFLEWHGSQIAMVAYPSIKQKTNIKLLPSALLEYTKDEKSALNGHTLVYGEFTDVKALSTKNTIVRYEYTAAMILFNQLDRLVEVSHWGQNVAIENKFGMTHAGAEIKGLFSRVDWTRIRHAQSKHSAITNVQINLAKNANYAYYVDEIGNVSTSAMQRNSNGILLVLQPRYPLFGSWNYTFVAGWNYPLSSMVHKIGNRKFSARIPMLEGPTDSQYKHVQLTVSLPEGARSVVYYSPIALKSAEIQTTKKYLDFRGRTELVIKIDNVTPEILHQDLIVEYEYPILAGLMKPLNVMWGLGIAYLAYFALCQVDMRISGKP